MGATLEALVAVERRAGPEHPIVRSRELFGAEREVVIVHREQTYRLRIARTTS